MSWTYYNPTKVASVDTEEALKAGQVLEPASDIQLCARIAGAATKANAPQDQNLSMLAKESLVVDQSWERELVHRGVSNPNIQDIVNSSKLILNSSSQPLCLLSRSRLRAGKGR